MFANDSMVNMWREQICQNLLKNFNLPLKVWRWKLGCANSQLKDFQEGKDEGAEEQDNWIKEKWSLTLGGICKQQLCFTGASFCGSGLYRRGCTEKSISPLNSQHELGLYCGSVQTADPPSQTCLLDCCDDNGPLGSKILTAHFIFIQKQQTEKLTSILEQLHELPPGSWLQSSSSSSLFSSLLSSTSASSSSSSSQSLAVKHPFACWSSTRSKYILFINQSSSQPWSHQKLGEILQHEQSFTFSRGWTRMTRFSRRSIEFMSGWHQTNPTRIKGLEAKGWVQRLNWAYPISPSLLRDNMTSDSHHQPLKHKEKDGCFSLSETLQSREEAQHGLLGKKEVVNRKKQMRKRT